MTNQDAVLELLGVEPGEHFKADLHSHTVVSDGSDTHFELIGKARVHGVTHLAITNHDTVQGIDHMVEVGRHRNFHVIGGVEISAWDPREKKRVHILGLGLTSNAPAITALCEATLQARDENTRWQMRTLQQAGYSVNVERVEELAAQSTCMYKQHLMAGLTEAPYSSPDYQHLYKALFKNGGIAQRDIEYVDMCSAVEAIVADGGYAVLAHPGQFGNFDAVPHLVQAGLSGIEQFHPEHRGGEQAICHDLAQRYNLFVTGGSDYHGAYGKVPCPGYRTLSA